jgi:hypothetical protein
MFNIENIWKQFNGDQVHCGINVDIPDRETVEIRNSQNEEVRKHIDSSL